MSDPSKSESITPPPAGGSLGAVEVDALDFERGAIGGVRATDVAARLALVGGIAANHASVERGAVSGILAREATVRQGLVRSVVAQNAHVEQALVRAVVANTVETGPTTGILIAVARRIDGEAKILLDWRGALAFGASLGAFLALIRLARHRS
ncbi:MAG: hypothetical protein ABIG85_00115 [Chloroflexota bacterium]